jgi:tetratricopeptide (TPR) repeat protein
VGRAIIRRPIFTQRCISEFEKSVRAIVFALRWLPERNSNERLSNDRYLRAAMTHNNLGNALHSLGERESVTARLEEAVTACRDALLECTRDRVPLDWAMTQNNLGTALQTLGERESGTARLEEAVTAYRDALLERTRDRVPLDWATTQHNLGDALTRLGERESGTARLEEAVTAYRDALLERTRDRVPLDWATTQNNLGNALQTLGARKNDQWVVTQNNLDRTTKLLDTMCETEVRPSTAEMVREEFSSMGGLFM